MVIRITKHHIGAEIISILTRGMYPDPRDALREYVQNGVDADANNIDIRIRGSSIVVIDDGYGMDQEVMKDAVRVGISDKDPSADVGFRGIGIYSAFHLCDRLNIYSKVKGKRPCVLMFDFKSMRETLSRQRLERMNGRITGRQLIDLQSILQDNIDIGELKEEEFPKGGTRVEMVGLDSSFFISLSRFDEVADYLRQVVPLHFDREGFKYGERIEDNIHQICQENNAVFRVVDLDLQVDAKEAKLYRPYTDELFHDSAALPPVFKEIKSKKDFFGVAWGCLNEARRKIADTKLRGFLLTKQGFALGKRADMARHFGKRTTYFDRYVGEIIVVDQQLLPNAARTDFEVSPQRTSFYEALAGVAAQYNARADKHQEYTLGDEQLNSAIERIHELESSIVFNYEKTEQLLDCLVEVRTIRQEVDGRINRGSFRQSRIDDANKVVRSAKAIEKDIQNFIESSKEKANRKKKDKKTPEEESRERRTKLPKKTATNATEKPTESLVEVFESIDITLPAEVRKALEIIDERFVQAWAANKSDYLLLLKELKEEIEQSVLGQELQ